MRSGLLVLLGSLVIYGLGYWLYGGFLRKLFKLDEKRKTPAHTMYDGVDYVPAKPFVLFGHHFASIAGAGPIVGPILAVEFGWLPVLLWLLIGCIFVGAMHDMAAMVLSVRHQGKSIASIIEEYIGFWGRQLFIVFCLATLILVVAVFADMVAKGFMANPAVATASILFIAISPIFGTLVYKKGVSLLLASLIFVPIAFSFIYVGQIIPLDIGQLFNLGESTEYFVWMIILMLYAAAASTLPVWLLLQPRDYLSSYLLYVMLAFGLIGICFYNPELQTAAYTSFTNAKGQGLFPILFITVACGACSGFHSLVASGTSAKQLANEKDIQPVGYGAMLVEGVLGVVALISVAYIASGEGSAPVRFADGLATFGEKLGIPHAYGNIFVAMSVSAFLLTSLDTATRLARFMFQELFIAKNSTTADVEAKPKTSFVASIFQNMYVATAIVVICSLLLALSAADDIWPLFGSVNQLLAAITLLVISLWLIRRRTTPIIAIIPLIFMFAVSGSGLCSFAAKVMTKSGALLGVLAIIILLLSLVLILLSILSIIKEYKKR
ncbi:MAG: carbon starvation protein A [Kiritimatiellae bacterium]|nr:carbon starvation protein A [Kiritimatiellia bacterium]